MKLQFTYSPTVRSLFHRRAGKGVRAKLSEGVSAVLGNSNAGSPRIIITKIPFNAAPNMNIHILKVLEGLGAS